MYTHLCALFLSRDMKKFVCLLLLAFVANNVAVEAREYFSRPERSRNAVVVVSDRP